MLRKSRSQLSGESHSRGIWAGRIAFLTTLGCVAILLGVLADLMLSRAEETLAKQQFNSIASRAAVNLRLIFKRKLHGVNAMAIIAANANPNTDEWPFVFVQGFEEIASELMLASDGRGMGFGPLVEPADVRAFEDFAYTYFNTTRQPERFPPGAGESSFGKGIWGRMDGVAYHDDQVERNYETEFDYFAPVLHQDIGEGSILMYNLRSEKIRGQTLDDMVRCSLQENSVCHQITDIINLVTNGRGGSPAALLVSPVLPSINRKTFPSGFMASSIVFSEVFENVFGREVDGVLCVLETASSNLEFLVERGQRVTLVNEQRSSLTNKYKDLKIETFLTSDKLFGDASPVYKITLYPTRQFFNVYSTGNSLLASVGSVIIIVFTGLLFMVYDFYVRREFSHKSELLETKRKFMRFVCHEVRTPMNSVCLGLSLIQEEMESALKSGIELEKVQNWTDLSMEVNQSAQRAVDVLSDLLNYDKIEQGQFKLELSMFTTRDIVEKTSSEFNLEARRRGLNCTINLNSAMDCVLVGDKLRLTQVLRNLLSNALKFTPEGGDLKITVHEELLDLTDVKGMVVETRLHCGKVIPLEKIGKAQISIADSGVGMTRSQIDNLFMDGVQFNVNQLQAGKGSGIGLYIAKGIVDQHEGKISCDSPGIGRGSVFTLELPLYRLTAAGVKECYSDGSGARTENLSADTPIKTTGRTSPLHFLVVDDSTTNRKLLIRLLEREGHRCKGASDGKEAVEMIKEGKFSFDVILLDFEMPVMNGPDAATAIRSMGHKMLIIGITGNVLSDDVRYFKDKGADEVLAKPVKIDEIDIVIGRFAGEVSAV